MAEKQVLLALADRCEREGPSRGLDADIAVACRIGSEKVGKDHWSYRNFPTSQARDDGRVEAGMHWPSPCFTSSLDAAVTLLPEGWGMALRQYPSFMPVASIWRTLSEPAFAGTARTLPAALCAASLRARAAQPEGE